MISQIGRGIFMYERKKAKSFQELEKELIELKNNGKKVLEINLSLKERDFLIERGYIVEPFLYYIKTKRFSKIKDCPCIYRELHFMCKNKKMVTIRKLKKKEIQLLKEANIKYRPVRYYVYL